MAKKGIGFIIFVLVIVLGCTMPEQEPEPLVPSKLPTIGFTSYKSMSKSIIPSTTGTNETFYSLFAPVLSGFSNNTENLAVGQNFSLSHWDSTENVSVSISNEGDTVLFTGTFDDGKSYFKLWLDETAGTFKYIHAIKVNFEFYNTDFVLYSMIPETSIDTTDYSLHTHFVGFGISVDFGYPFNFVGCGGEFYLSSSVTGFLYYDTMNIAYAPATTSVADLDTYISKVEEELNGVTWNPANLDKANSLAPSQWYVFDKTTKQFGSIDCGSVYDDMVSTVNTAGGILMDDSSRLAVPWTPFESSAYTTFRANIIGNFIK